MMEMQGQPTAARLVHKGQELDPISLEAIRSLMDEATQPCDEERETRFMEGPLKSVRIFVPEEEIERLEGKSPSRLAALKARALAYRPTPKHIAIALAAALLWFQPWLVFWGLVFGVFVLVGTFMALGYDGFWQRVMRLGHQYAKRNPRRAVALHRRLDGFAMKWDMILDRFPDGTVDALYMPDFGELARAEKRHDAALDRRFAMLREGDA